MTTIQQGIITLLRSAITGQALPLPSDFQIGEAMDLVRSHSMSTLVYTGAVNCGIDPEEPAMQRLFSLYCKALLQSEGQLRQLKRLYAAFDEAHIDYMPLKGSKMKALYPSPELRLMGDADILIRMEQYPQKIVPVMEGLGFAAGHESDHELVWEGSGLHLELHKRLIPSYNQDFYAYFGDGWKLAVPESGSRHTMTAEAEWIYLFTHFAKHFRDGGIGCRHVVDLWVYLRSHPELKEECVQQELKKLGLLDFYGTIRGLLRGWFEDGGLDARSELATDYVFASGSWGAVETRTLSQNLRGSRGNRDTGKSRLRYLRRAAFPDCMTLREKYTVLKKAPWMLPAVWVYRPFYKVLFERDSIHRHRNSLEHINRDSLSRQVQLLRYVGLNEDF